MARFDKNAPFEHGRRPPWGRLYVKMGDFSTMAVLRLKPTVRVKATTRAPWLGLRSMQTQI